MGGASYGQSAIERSSTKGIHASNVPNGSSRNHAIVENTHMISQASYVERAEIRTCQFFPSISRVPVIQELGYGA